MAGGAQQVSFVEDVLEVIMKITFLILVLLNIWAGFMYVKPLTISNLFRNFYCFYLFSV